MKYDRLWDRLLEFLNEWASARGVPGGIEVTFTQSPGMTRTVEVVVTSEEWESYVSTIYGTGDPRATTLKKSVLTMPDGVHYLVYDTYDWRPSQTRELPEDDIDPGPGEWVVTDGDGTVHRFAGFESGEAFFAAVDALLTPGMAKLGYHRIGGSMNDEPASRGPLVAESSGEVVEPPSPRPFLRFDFGFEAGSDDARRKVNPDDLETADELWLSYDPGSGELDLRDWDFVSDHLDWNPRTHVGPCFGAEVEARLGELGRAVIELAEQRPR